MHCPYDPALVRTDVPQEAPAILVSDDIDSERKVGFG